jgi:hypothetical protein
MLFLVSRVTRAPVEHWCNLAVLFGPMDVAEVISRNLAFMFLMVRPLWLGSEC